MTCRDNKGFVEERKPKPGATVDHRGRVETVEVLTPVEDIVDMFKHNNLRAMKGD